MVQVIYGAAHGGSAGPESEGTGPTTLIHIHSVQRHVHGNSIKIEVEGEMKIASHQYVYARELKLGTLQVLLLTPELNRNDTHGYMAQKFIYHKGELDNYASIDVYDDAAEDQTPGVGPVDGSIWLDFIAKGEA
jgi:hypothetical protein